MIASRAVVTLRDGFGSPPVTASSNSAVKIGSGKKTSRERKAETFATPKCARAIGQQHPAQSRLRWRSEEGIHAEPSRGVPRAFGFPVSHAGKGSS